LSTFPKLGAMLAKLSTAKNYGETISFDRT
jgi:hypothetical protein